MSGGHHPCGPVEHRSEVVSVAQFGFTGGNPYPHRQLKCPLCRERSIDSRARRRERGGRHAVTVVAGGGQRQLIG
jgi:hypothetical protein